MDKARNYMKITIKATVNFLMNLRVMKFFMNIKYCNLSRNMVFCNTQLR